MRLDKYLADMKAGTRSSVKELIRKGRVSVNGTIVKDAAKKVEMTDEIRIDGDILNYIEYEYVILNKPQGYICALEDNRYPVVMELLETKRKDLVPVGRLDVDTEGILLLTNDGMLNHKLLAPKSHVDKKYYVEVDKDIPEDAAEVFSNEMDLGDFIARPSHLEILDKRKACLSIQEGKFHQVKRMFEKIGCTVTYLKRVSFGPLELEDLPVGEYRSLSEQEIEALKNA